ncbi:MAG: adenine methyltransferase [Pseudomonadota bacterium]|nr:adenine methyltransferase [Pseudomonadota bacterium]
MNKSVHFSSMTGEWSTPADLFKKLDDIFHFDLDVCATAENAKCRRYFDKSQDGLSQIWKGTCWMNPPYGREIGSWIKKAHEASYVSFGSVYHAAARVVCLVPARTDTRWWHDYTGFGYVIYIRGRLKFGGCKNSAPFPSAIVLFGDFDLYEMAKVHAVGKRQS